MLSLLAGMALATLSPFSALDPSLTTQGDAVALKRTFVPKQRESYKYFASLHLEKRTHNVVTYIPEDVDIFYNFTVTVLGVNGGIASVRYERPSITESESESGDEKPKDNVEKIGQVDLLQISPINEILDHHEVSRAKPKKEDENSGGENLRTRGAFNQESIGEFIGPFIQDMERQSLFIGSIDSSLDFAPKLDLKPVKVGDTWKRTVGFQPQKLKSKSGKTEVQRLDITYSYAGPSTLNGKPVLKVHADLNLNTDLGAYLNQVVGATADETHIKSIPLKLDTKLDFFLDPKTLQTLSATVDSEGGFTVITTLFPEPVEEEKLKGHATLSLLGNKMVVAKPTH